MEMTKEKRQSLLHRRLTVLQCKCKKFFFTTLQRKVSVLIVQWRGNITLISKNYVLAANAAHTLILIVSSSFPARASSLVRDSKRILSKASEALEINSLRKIYNKEEKHEHERTSHRPVNYARTQNLFSNSPPCSYTEN